MINIDINLISKIIDFNSSILYDFLCVNKYISNELLKNITFLCLPNNNKLVDENYIKIKDFYIMYSIKHLNLCE